MMRKPGCSANCRVIPLFMILAYIRTKKFSKHNNPIGLPSGYIRQTISRPAFVPEKWNFSSRQLGCMEYLYGRKRGWNLVFFFLPCSLICAEDCKRILL